MVVVAVAKDHVIVSFNTGVSLGLFGVLMLTLTDLGVCGRCLETTEVGLWERRCIGLSLFPWIA